MIPLTMMARLLEAVRPTARLVLVGDPDQLTPVEAGAVLSDLVHRPSSGPPPDLPAAVQEDLADLDDEDRRQLHNGVVRLRVSHRYGAAIGGLAEAVRTGDADRVLDLLDAGGPLSLVAGTEELEAEAKEAGAALRSAATAADAVRCLALQARHRLLCAHRHGSYGVSHWNDQIMRWTGGVPGEWRPGDPLIVTANDYENGLNNGDTGVVVQTPDGLRAAFPGDDAPRLLALSRLAAVSSANALTVHRSQGSQYEAVTILLPPAASPILTRELLYTAVTRASRSVRVIATEDAVACRGRSPPRPRQRLTVPTREPGWRDVTRLAGVARTARLVDCAERLTRPVRPLLEVLDATVRREA